MRQRGRFITRRVLPIIIFLLLIYWYNEFTVDLPSPAKKPSTSESLLNYMTPKLNCTEKIRVGGRDDGGKWTCNPKRIPKDCVVYSLGVGKNTDFEKDFHEKSASRCQIYSFDAGPQAEELFAPFNGKFMQLNIHAHTNASLNHTSLHDIFLMLNHTRVEILKMDIETWEFEVLDGFFEKNPISNTFTAFCQLLVEFHGFHEPERKIDLWLPMLEKLDELGFSMFSAEAETAWDCYEFSFLHKSCYQQYGVFSD